MLNMTLLRSSHIARSMMDHYCHTVSCGLALITCHLDAHFAILYRIQLMVNIISLLNNESSAYEYVIMIYHE